MGKYSAYLACWMLINMVRSKEVSINVTGSPSSAVVIVGIGNTTRTNVTPKEREAVCVKTKYQ